MMNVLMTEPEKETLIESDDSSGFKVNPGILLRY